MTLRQFKNLVHQQPEGKQFSYGLSDPFAWRGRYDEVAFAVLNDPMTREDVLVNIEKAYQGTFIGYKGGEFRYDDHTPVNFENADNEYTDGGYCANTIANILDEYAYETQEMKLASLAFS